jgi:hypothetical protein
MVLGWFGLAMSGWEIIVDNCDWLVKPIDEKGEGTYNLGKVVNFVISRVDIT